MTECFGCQLKPGDKVRLDSTGPGFCTDCNGESYLSGVIATYEGFLFDEGKGYKAHIFTPDKPIYCPNCGNAFRKISMDCLGEGYGFELGYAVELPSLPVDSEERGGI